MENGFRWTVAFCFDAGERLLFDAVRLLLLRTDGRGQVLEAVPPALRPGEHLLLHPDLKEGEELGGPPELQPTPFPTPVSQPPRAAGCLLGGFNQNERV